MAVVCRRTMKKDGPNVQKGVHLAWHLGETRVLDGVSQVLVLWQDDRYKVPAWVDEKDLTYVNAMKRETRRSRAVRNQFRGDVESLDTYEG
jgi:hypothetical protein